MHSRHRAWIAAVACVVLAAGPARACLWDRDTLADEERGLPEMSSIILGRYERHTPEFLERRIRLARTALTHASPSEAKALLDDIGVAQDRLNRQPEAIATMQEKIRRFGVDYTTAANLGTFYAHASQLAPAEGWIRRALKINPEAHFGREWVQLHAIRYFRSAKQRPLPKVRPTAGTERRRLRFRFWGEPFLEHSEPLLLGMSGGAPSQLSSMLREAKLPANALEGIAGIVRMGDRESPELYAALAQLLRVRGDNSLAALAYWRALEAGGEKHPLADEWDEASVYARMSIHLDAGQIPMSRSTYEWGRDYSRRWVAAYRERERELIRTGQDPEAPAHYAEFYRKWGRPQDPLPVPVPLSQNGWIFWIPLLSLGGGLVYWLWRRRPLVRTRPSAAVK